MVKKFVKVLLYTDEDGKKIPLKIIWETGEQFEIDKVLDVKNRASLKVGGIGERYTIRVKGIQTYLWYEDGKWFVEAK